MAESLKIAAVAAILVLSQVSWAQPAPSAAPGAAAPAVAPASPPSAFQLVLNEGKRLAAQGKYYDAALVFHKILAEGEEGKEYFQEAQYELGVALFQLRFFNSAFQYFDRVVDAGVQHLRYNDSLPWLLKIHRELPGETNSLYRMASYPASGYPADIAQEISFYVGQYYYYEGNLAAALEALNRVGPDKPDLYVKALYLKGVVFVRKNEAASASEAFKEVSKFLEGRKIADGGRYREMATMAMARVYYSAGFAGKSPDRAAFETAIKYYDRIPDTSDQWLDSLFEKSWAYFQIGNFTRALGNILTVNSPYFEEEYYPESHVLKAMIFFKNCLYEEALATVNPFYKEYYEVLKELDVALQGKPDPADFYQYLASISARGAGKGAAYSLKVKKIFNAALADKKLRRLFGFVIDINKEIGQLEELRKHPLAKSMADFLLPDLIAYRSLTISEAGKLARERLGRVRKELNGLLSSALKVRFETLNAQKGILEEKFRKEQVVETKGPGAPTENFQVDREHAYWPWDGEYWKDELGSYYYPVRSVCGAPK